MSETIDDIVRRIVREELAKAPMGPQIDYRGVSVQCTCHTTAACPLHGRGAFHTYPKDVDWLRSAVGGKPL